MSDLTHQTGPLGSSDSNASPVRSGRLHLPLTSIPLASAASQTASSSGLLEYWRIIRSHKGLLAIFAIVGALAGFMVGLPKTPVYRARTSLEVLELNEDFMNMKQSNPISTTDYSYDTSESQTQVKILESDALMKRVLEALGGGGTDPAVSSQVGAGTSVWDKFLHFGKPGGANKRRRLLGEAAASRAVRVTPRTRILELTIDSTDPQLAADFANTLANAYMEESQETRWKSSQKTSEWLAKELNDTRLKLERSETALQAYARTSSLIFTATETNIENQKLLQIQEELSAATADRINKQSRYELAQKAPPDSLPDVINDTPLRQTEGRLNELRGQVASLRATYSPEYSKTKRVEAEMSSIAAVFDRDRNDILQRIKNDYDEAARKERLLSSAYDQQTRQVIGQSEKSIQYNILKREVDSNRQLYDTMLQQLKQSTVASAMRTSNVRVVDTADVPTVPIAPNFKVNTILGFVTALFLGSAYILLRSHGNRKLQGPGDLHFWTGLPELGAIPNVSAANLKRWSDARTTTLDVGTVSATAGFSANCASMDSAGNVDWKRKPGVVAEAFRTVLTSLLFTCDHDKFPKILVFTSTDSGDGKTTIVGNLGIALAEIGRKVLIIDGDLRRPRIHTLFGLEGKGLANILCQQEPFDPAAGVMVQRSRIARLDLLAIGETSSSADLLYSQHLRRVLDQLSRNYDAILIDTPPMRYLTDARLLARFADGVILVARAKQTTRDAVLAATKQLVEDRVPILGFILNDWTPKKSSALHKDYGETPLSVYESQKNMSRTATA